MEDFPQYLPIGIGLVAGILLGILVDSIGIGLGTSIGLVFGAAFYVFQEPFLRQGHGFAVHSLFFLE